MHMRGKGILYLWAGLVIFSACNAFAQINGNLSISFVPIANEKQSDAAIEGATANPDIDISPLSKDFGNVAVGSSSDATFKISNKGLANLIISAVSGSGPDTDQFSLVGSGEPLPPPYTLPPFLSVSITARFRPTSPGLKRASIQVTCNDPDEGTLTVQLSGTGVGPDISISPAEKNYGNVLKGASARQTFVVSNTGAVSLSVSSTSLLGTDSGQFSIDSGGGAFTLAAGASREVAVSFRPTGLGAKSAFFRIASNDPDENPLDVNLSGTGVTPDIAVAPASKSYGNVLIGTMLSQIFVVSNTGTASLNVTSTTLLGTDPGQFKIDGGGGAFTLSPGTARNVAVSFAPTTTGAKKATLRIANNDTDENPFDIALTGTAVVPDISVLPIVKNFDGVAVDSAAIQTFVVSNAGTADLIVNSIKIAGNDSTQFSIILGDGTFTLAPGASRDLVVRFKPDSLGHKNAILRLASNDPDEKLVDVLLSGQGIAPNIVVLPGTIDFGHVPVDSGSLQKVIVKNTGTADLLITSTAFLGSDSLLFSLAGDTSIFTIAPADSHQLVILFQPDTVGAKNGVLRIVSNDPDEHIMDVNLQGSGVRPEITITPDSVDYGYVLVDSMATRTILVINSGSADLTITALELAGADSAQFFLPAGTGSFLLPPGARQEIVVVFQPIRAADQHATLRVKSNASQWPMVEIPLRGTGAAPQIVVRPLTLDFASVLAGGTSQAAFWIVNAGNAELSLSAASMVGPDSSDFVLADFSSKTVAAQDSSMFIILFKPVSLGAKSATVEIFSNDRDDPPVEISLHGECNENQPPYLVYFYPADSARAVPGNTPVQFKVKDDGAGIDLSSLEVQIAGFALVKNGIDQTNGQVEILHQRTNVTVFYAPKDPFSQDTVLVRISCADSTSPANTMVIEKSFRAGSTLLHDGLAQIVGPAGGDFINPHSGVQVSVPSAALPDSFHILLAEADGSPALPNGSQSLGMCYHLAPYGLQAGDSVTVRLPYAAADLALYGVKDPNDLWVYQFSAFTGEWQRSAPNAADSNYVYLKTREFSYTQLATHTEEIQQFLQLKGPSAVQVKGSGAYFVNRIQTSYGHDLEYQFDWGDGSVSAWSADTTGSHVWINTGFYKVIVRGRCPSDTTVSTSSNVLQVQVDAIAAVAAPTQAINLPTTFDLQQNYPNPFNPTTTIKFQIPATAQVTITIYDVLGKKVKTLIDEEKPAGYFQVAWDAQDETRQQMASGVYLCHLAVAGYTKYIKMLLLR